MRSASISNSSNMMKARSESISAISTLSSLSSSSSSASRGSTPHHNYSMYADQPRIPNTSDYDGRYPASPPLPPAAPPQTTPSHSSDYLSSPTTRFYHPNHSTASPISRHAQGFDFRNSYATEEEQQEAIAMMRPSLSAKANASSMSVVREQPLSLPLPPTPTPTQQQQQQPQQLTPAKTYPMFPPTEEMKLKANKALLESETSFRVLYAGDAVYKPDKKILSKSKRGHFVLTNNQLLLYKSSQKARSEINFFEFSGTQSSHSISSNSSITQGAASKMIDKDRVFLDLSSVYAVQLVATSLYTFRIEYFHPQSGQALSHTLTADNEREARQWVQTLRKAVCVHHPRIDSISGTEKYAVLDRMAKQSDTFSNSDQVKMYKVVFKEKRYKIAGGDQPKEVFLPVIMAIGKFSFYFLPISVLDDEYLKTVERDRFGVLSIHSIRYDNADDTVVIDVKQVGKSNRQLAFASTFCEEIIQYLYRSIESIIPGMASSLYDKMPNHIKYAQVVPYVVPLDPEDEMTGHDDEQVHRFNSTLRAYTAAMNMNKSRFNFTITGPLKAKSFTLLPPHEVGGTPPKYEKYELLAILRTIQSNNIFVEVCLAHCPLDELETWTAQPNHGWTFVKNHPLNDKNLLSNEIYNILTSLKLLRKLDLTDCSIGKSSPAEDPMRRHSAIATIGTVMRSGKTQLSRISVGKNKLTEADLSKLMNGIKEHKKSIKELYLNDCGLEKDMIEMVLRTLFEKNPDQIISLDLSSKLSNGMAIDPALVEKMVIHFKRLEILRMRGHNLLGANYTFLLESSRLRELDLGGSKMNSDIVARLCKWIQTPSFNCIESLHLADCNLNGKNVYDILVSISQSGNRSMHLNLAQNPIMKEVMHLPKLHSAILQGEGPKSISFARIEWDDSTLREFIDCLRDNQTITHLNLSDITMRDTDEISEDTVRMLTSLFERNTCLTELELNFDHNKVARSPLSAFQPRSLICNAIVQALPGLRHNASLQYLDISNLYIEDAGAFALARVLKTNKRLQSIILEDNNISIDGYRSLTKVIEESATQVINIPIPRKDLRSQLSYLVFRIEELIISENEAQFFLIHTTASDKKKSKKHELEMIAQERKKCEMALQNFESVIHALMVAVRKNMREVEEQNYRNMEFQMQAQTAAQELAIAQVRLQGARSPSGMSGTNLSAVGVVSRARNASSSNASTTSSTNSSVYGSLSRSASRNTYQGNSRRSVFGSDYSLNSGMVSPTPFTAHGNYNDTRMYRSPSNNIHEEPHMLGKPHSYDGNMMVQSPVTPALEYSDPYYKYHGSDYAESLSTSGNFNPYSLQHHSQQQQQQQQQQGQQSMMALDNTSYAGIDDPGFISDFGYVDDFEQGMMIDPHYLVHHRNSGASSSNNCRESIWNEEQIAQRLQRGLYLPPDERD
ncbi:fatty-acyl coenzyme A oxidase [Mucor velutinosus]|uniref:Fatty-acyl coenzyme A oxidase n=1 Tax=Mucor velutinosus TaxID=708070 RepID=A0AAN7DQU2_9FUNG|nr:fatty-acyl coenzyme A oxidase [Mucor velutinosus]